jgi:hypothetical protein
VICFQVVIDPFNGAADYDNSIAHTNFLTVLSQGVFVGRVSPEGVGEAVTITIDSQPACLSTLAGPA